MARTPIRGTNGKDRMDVRNGSNDVFALAGDDVIQLLSTGDTAGNNFVDAGDGNDGVINNFEGGNEILLGAGDDTYVGFGFALGGVGDVVRGGSGKDLFAVQTLSSTYFGDSGNDTFVSIGHRNTFNGGSGIDLISYENRTDSSVAGRTGVFIRLDEGKTFTGNSTFETLISIENARGSARDDTIVGDEGANSLEGLDGDDLILGNGGNDKLFGGLGNDELQGGTGNDQLDGGSGDDKLFGEAGNDTLKGGSGNDKLFGESGADELFGGSGNDELHGGTNHDKLFGDSGEDKLFGDNGNDTLSGGNNSDELHGGSGNDILNGDSGHDKLFGDDGNDTLNGGTGKDVLNGGLGKDILTGGAHDDIFDFNSIAEISASPNATHRDVITDFTRGQDRIDLSTIDANTTLSGNQAFTLRSGEQTSFTGVAGQLFWDKQGSGSNAITAISGDVNGDRVADFQLELTGHITLTTSDFIL